jgi:hypothetical protein
VANFKVIYNKETGDSLRDYAFLTHLNSVHELNIDMTNNKKEKYQENES